MEKIKLLLFFSLLSISNVFAQISNEEYYLLTENADNLIENEQFDKALPLYLRLNKNDTLNADLNFKIGVCYINSKLDKKKAVPYLEKAVSCPDKCTLKDDNDHLMGFSYLGDAPIRILVKEFGVSKYLAIFLMTFFTMCLIVLFTMKEF